VIEDRLRTLMRQSRRRELLMFNAIAASQALTAAFALLRSGQAERLCRTTFTEWCEHSMTSVPAPVVPGLSAAYRYSSLKLPPSSSNEGRSCSLSTAEVLLPRTP
jgi:hypothetical protein